MAPEFSSDLRRMFSEKCRKMENKVHCNEQFTKHVFVKHVCSGKSGPLFTFQALLNFIRQSSPFVHISRSHCYDYNAVVGVCDSVVWGDVAITK